MLIEALQSILRAAGHALEVTCDWKVTDEGIAPLDSKELSLSVSTVFHQHAGPIQSIMLSCDQGLTRHMAELLLPGADPEKDAETSAFRILGSVFQQTLARETDWYTPSRDFHQFGPGNLRMQSTGERCFHLHLPTPAGSLHLVVTGAAASEIDGIPESPAEGDAITGEAVDEVVDGLVAREADIQVELAVTRSRVALHHATVVARGTAGAESTLVLSSGCLANRKTRPEAGSPLTVYLVHNGKLYQFRSRVMEIIQRPMGVNASLPLLVVRVPVRITRGQRRRAFRISPTEPIAARVGACRLHGDAGIFETEGIEKATVRDLSFLGVRLVAPQDTFLTQFVEGSLVLCELQLPDPWGKVKVAGIARRIRSASDGPVGEDQLGIEFLSAPSQRIFDGALDTVRQFVLGYQRQVARDVKRAA